MKTYLVIFKKSGKKLLFKYNLNGFLIAFKTDLIMTKDGVDYLCKHFPFELDQLEFFKTHKEFRVDEVKQDLSFQTFWNTYKHKVGNKPRAEKLWNALNETDKAKALSYIATYNNHLLNNQGIQKLYPETYLNQKRFDND